MQAERASVASLAFLLIAMSAAAQTAPFDSRLISTVAQDRPPLRWGGDAEGGAPFVEADPNDPQKVSGFDVEIAELIAGELGRRAEFVQVAFSSLDQSAIRGDFDIGLSGIEDTPARRASVAASIPYYRFREVLTVRDADRDRYRTLADLRGRRVATRSPTTCCWRRKASTASCRSRTTTTCIPTATC
jgi:ABC-type amino acid transport substrate-binding protein